MKANVVASALKVLEALRYLCESDGPVSLVDLRRHLGVSEPTAYRVLQTLIHTGHVRHAWNDRGYEPTLEVARLGGLVTSRDHVIASMRAQFGPLNRRFEEPVMVGVPDGDHILFVEKLAGPRDPNFYCDIGKRLPLHVGAAARSILAQTSEDYFERYLAHGLGKRTPATRNSAERLRQDRDFIRTHGYAWSVDEVDEGISAVGVPITNGLGQVLAAAAIANVSVRWQEHDVELRAKEMKAAAASVMADIVDLPARQVVGE